MWILNKNSENLIKIGLCEIGSYLQIDKPISLDWSDCKGSMGRYCTLLGMKNEKFISLSNELNNLCYKHYSEDNEYQLYEDFKPLFKLLENGLYFLSYSENLKLDIANQFLIFPRSSSKFSPFLKENDKNVLDFTTNWYFEDSGFYIIATQLEKTINIDRVNFYKNEIISGKRPFIITTYKSYIEDKLSSNKTNEYIEWDSALFLLDGHHKFLAYKELRIPPPTFTICQGFSNRNEIYFDFTKLKEHLNLEQIKHLTKNIE